MTLNSHVKTFNAQQVNHILFEYSNKKFLMNYSVYQALSDIMDDVSGFIYRGVKPLNVYQKVAGYCSDKHYHYVISPDSCKDLEYVIWYLRTHFVGTNELLNKIYSFMKPSAQLLKDSSKCKGLLETTTMYHKALREYMNPTNRSKTVIFWTNYDAVHGLSFHVATKKDLHNACQMLIKRIQHNAKIKAQIEELKKQML